jgi:hypothetical protein
MLFSAASYHLALLHAATFTAVGPLSANLVPFRLFLVPGFRAESLRLDLKGDETVESLIRPVLEHLEKLLDHGEDANLDPKPSTYLLAWLSYFVRNPGMRSKVAIILRGVQVGFPSSHSLLSCIHCAHGPTTT